MSASPAITARKSAIQVNKTNDSNTDILSTVNDGSILVGRQNSRVILEYTHRNQELTNIVHRQSDGIIIDERELAEYAHELSNYHSVLNSKLAVHFQTSLSKGLKPSVAQELLDKNGPNVLPKAAELPLWIKFIMCFLSGFAPLLWIAFIFVFLSYEPFGTPPSNIYNLALAIALLIVVFLSGIFTFIQEVQSSLVMSGFSNMLPPNCIVLRDGNSMSISPTALVVGDIVLLETGMRVPSDIRIVSASDLKIDKSMLTGETDPIKLFAEPVDATTSMLQANNMAFMGCNVVEGEGIGIVIATGMNNQLSKIAAQVNEVTMVTTSLQRDINRFVIIIGTLAFTTAVVVILEWAFYLDVKHSGFMTVSAMIANAISVLVAFVPEGLPLALQTGLTIIANRLCGVHKVLVRQLSIIETIGSMTLLASDKTGTLTQNKMTVFSIITSAGETLAMNVTSSAANHLNQMMQVTVLCNQSKLDEERAAVGSNGIDKALLNWAEKLNKVDWIHSMYKTAILLPFSSATKISCGVISLEDQAIDTPVEIGSESDAVYRVIMKGAPEYVIERCSCYMDESTGQIKPLMKTDIDRLMDNIAAAANTGKRVIALASYDLPAETFHTGYHFKADPQPNFPLHGLVFVCCVAVSDPPRVDVDKAINILRGAGITVAMVTGDAVNTAIAIAKQVNIISDPAATPQSIDSLRSFNVLERQLAEKSDIESGKVLVNSKPSATVNPTSNKASSPYELIPSNNSVVATTQLEDFVKTNAIVIDGRDLELVSSRGWDFIFAHSELVFARTTPHQKLQIVKESQQRGFRVGVTGDGVNDSPALKRADVGIAMGLSGSDVAKDAAKVVLLNDDFNAVTKAVEEGRLIFANLRKVIGYQIAAGCWSELIPVLATFFLGMPQPLSSFLMIIISCVTDVYAGIALMNETAETSLMTEKPRNLKKSKLVPFRLIAYSYLFYGTMQSIGSFINYFLYMSERGPIHTVPTPIPVDDDGSRSFPAGYLPSQLIGAWNWGLATSGSGLAEDEMSAASAASSVFFVTLVVSQMGHLLTIRKKTPYFNEIILSEDSILNKLKRIISEIRPLPRVIAAWLGTIVTTLIFNEIPIIQKACGTGHVPGRYWGFAIGWSVLCFTINETRKWIVLLYRKSWVAQIAWEYAD